MSAKKQKTCIFICLCVILLFCAGCGKIYSGDSSEVDAETQEYQAFSSSIDIFEEYMEVKVTPAADPLGRYYYEAHPTITLEYLPDGKWTTTDYEKGNLRQTTYKPPRYANSTAEMILERTLYFPYSSDRMLIPTGNASVERLSCAGWDIVVCREGEILTLRWFDENIFYKLQATLPLEELILVLEGAVVEAPLAQAEALPEPDDAPADSTTPQDFTGWISRLEINAEAFLGIVALCLIFAAVLLTYAVGRSCISIRFFWEQIVRSRLRLGLNCLLLTVVIAFFVMSMNLYESSIANLQKADETYSTIALMEIQGDIDSTGQLADPLAEDYAGFQSVGVKGYDISDIVGADEVLRYDLRSRYGAYIPGCVAMREDGSTTAFAGDLIRFQIIGDEPVELAVSTGGNVSTQRMQIQVTDHVLDCYAYGDQWLASCNLTVEDKARIADQIRAFNGTDETAAADYLRFEPGVEYVASITLGNVEWDSTLGKFVSSTKDSTQRYDRFSPYFDDYGREYWVKYRSGMEYPANTVQPEQPFLIQKWDELQKDPDLMTYYEQAAQAYEINNCSFAVTVTNDMMGVPAFHLGNAYLHDGRLITQEEYDTGKKVCVISSTLAEQQGWSVGDSLEMHFYEYDAFCNNNREGFIISPIFHQQTEGFFYQDEYEIVGIYHQREQLGSSETEETTLALPWNTIYVPEKAVQNLPEQEKLVHAALLTVWLKNGTVDDFLSKMDELGITEKRAGDYQVTFRFYDQGYSTVQAGLEAMEGTAMLLLILSSGLLLITIILLAWFFAQQQKHSVGILRMLGGNRRQVVVSLLLCAMTISFVGAVVGLTIGHGLTDVVGKSIVERGLAEDSSSNAFSMVIMNGSREQTPLATGASLSLSLLSGSVGFLLFPVLMLVFVLTYIRKEPRALLPKSGV